MERGVPSCVCRGTDADASDLVIPNLRPMETPQQSTPADDLGFKLDPEQVLQSLNDGVPEGDSLDAAPTAQPSDSEFGASDLVLGRLTGDAEDFGPGSGTMGDTNSPSDEVI